MGERGDREERDRRGERGEREWVMEREENWESVRKEETAR